MRSNLTYLMKPVALLMTVLASFAGQGQSVSQIITDYNGWWKTSQSSQNPVHPDNHHNLLAFTFSGTTYSTGVNDASLTAHGETFTPGVYQALPLHNVAGTPSGNTKIGLGAMADGVYNGAGAAPSRTLGPYLNDGTNGLDLGTCVANLPAGTMFMSVSNIRPEMIGDGIPDIVVTQIADPSTQYDAYEFTDINGVRVGNSLNIVLTNISPIGTWVADFYEATGSTILQPGFTQTTRNIRLWAADFSVFGLDASNISDIAYFKINLNGNSDIAFVAYNATTITVQQVLDVQALPQRLRRPESEIVTNAIKLAPNPATNLVRVGHPKAEAGDNIIIFNAAGVPVKQVALPVHSTQTEVNVSDLPSGSYQVVLTGKSKKMVQRLVVQH